MMDVIVSHLWVIGVVTGLVILTLSLLAINLWGQKADTSLEQGIPTKFLEFENWRIRYHQSGQGPDLLLVHGLGANLSCWIWTLPLLRQHFRVTALDLPGFGQSSKPAHETYGLDEQSDRLEKILEILKIRKAFIVGNSMGGNIALWYAVKYPARVKALGLIGPASSSWLVPLPLSRLAWMSTPASWLLTKRALRWAHGRAVSRPEKVGQNRIDETFSTYGRNGQAVRSFLMATEAIRDSRLLARIKELQLPILILWGSRDRLVNRKVIDELEAALPAAESHVHLGGGHQLQEDEPEWVSEKLTSFFLA